MEDESGNRNNILKVEASKPEVISRPASRQSVEAPHTKPVSEVSPRPSMEARRPSTESVRSAISADSGLKISNAESQRPDQARIEDKQRMQQTRLGPVEPLTPPMTPDMWDKSAVDTTKFQSFQPAEIQRPASVASHYSDKSIEEAMPVEEEKEEKKIVVVQDEPTPRPTGLIAQMRMFLITLGTWMFHLVGGGMRMT